MGLIRIRSWYQESFVDEIVHLFFRFAMIAFLFASLFVVSHMLYNIQLVIENAGGKSDAELLQALQNLIGVAANGAISFAVLGGSLIGIGMAVYAAREGFYYVRKKRRVRRVRGRMLKYYEEYMRRLEAEFKEPIMVPRDMSIELPEFNLDVELPSEKRE